MKSHFSNARLILNKFLSDKTDVYLFSASILLTSLNIVLWRIYNFSENTRYLWRLSLSPVYFLLTVIGVNILLSFFASDKDENISHLLLTANIFIALLISILEVFYLVSLK